MKQKSLLSHFLVSALAVLSISLVWYLFYLLQLFDWGRGWLRGLVLLALIALVLCNRTVFKHSFHESGIASQLLLLLLLISCLYASHYFWKYRNNPHPVDVGTTTIVAVRWLVESGMNPYASPIDMQAPVEEGVGFYNGYKYFPLTLLTYGPFVWFLDVRGLYIVNYILLIVSFILLYLLSNIVFRLNSVAIYSALILFVTSPFMLYELFHQGVNDLLPGLFVIASFLAYAKQKETTAGFLLGLSLSAKYMPGIFLAPLLLIAVKQRLRVLIVMLIPPVVLVLPFFIWAPREFIGTMLVYLAIRAPDSSGVMYFLPEWLRVYWNIAGIIILVSLYGIFAWNSLRNKETLPSTKGTQRVVLFFTLITTIFCIFTSELHRNYLIWFLPAMTVCLGDLCSNVSGIILNRLTDK